jgi:hypothetical protein
VGVGSKASHMTWDRIGGTACIASNSMTLQAVWTHPALRDRTFPLCFYLVWTPAELDFVPYFYYFDYTESERFEYADGGGVCRTDLGEEIMWFDTDSRDCI